MSDEYLWDRSGEPDPEVQRLEALLKPLRHERPAPDFGAIEPVADRASRLNWLRMWWPRLAVAGAAAAVALVAVGVLLTYRGPRSAWDVARLEGAPRIGATEIGARGRLRVGQAVETDEGSRARINVGLIGEVDVEPNTRIRLLRAQATDHRLALDHGTMHARITAPPRLFYVETASALATDLGCKYTLSINESGAGLLEVSEGWVAFEKDGRESFVPAGAACVTRPVLGPGTPYFMATSDALRTALLKVDFDATSAAERAAALDIVLREARRHDALTLWHMLSRVRGDEIGRVYDRLAELVPPPTDVSRDAIVQGNRHMLDRWWDRLDLGKSFWWRIWKGPAPGR